MSAAILHQLKTQRGSRKIWLIFKDWQLMRQEPSFFRFVTTRGRWAHTK